MKCDEAQAAMRASIERETPLDARTAAHLTTCADCSEDFGDWTLDHALRSQAVPLPEDDFVDRAIAHAIAHAASRRTRRVAMAASIAVVMVAFAVLFGQPQRAPNDAATMAQVTLIAHEGKTVRVVIDSPAEQDAATVTIELADNLELTGFPNERRIEWQTSLSEGKNLLALPLTLMNDAESHFNVGLSYGSTRKDVRIAVHAVAHVSEPKQAEA